MGRVGQPERRRRHAVAPPIEPSLPDRRAPPAFDDIRQTVRIPTDRKEFDRWKAQENERLQRSGMATGKLAYTPRSPMPATRRREPVSTPPGISTSSFSS